jgi:hypothetical protein
MVRFLVGTIVVIMLLISASTVDQYQKTRGQTAEQRHENLRNLYGSTYKCDQAYEAWTRAGRAFDYVACVRGR